MTLRDQLRASFSVPTPYTGPQGEASTTTSLGSPWASSELESIVWSELVTDHALMPVTRAMIMTLPAYARGRDLICGTLGRISLQAVDAQGLEKVGTNSAMFVAAPDPNFSRYLTITWTVDDLIFHGVAWWLVTSRYSLDGRTKTISRVRPWCIAFHDGGRVMVDNREVDPADLIRIDGPGEGQMARASQSVRNALALEAAAAKFAASPVPVVELHQTDGNLDPAKVKALIESWSNARAGTNGLTAYTPANIEVRTHGEPVEALLVAGRNQQSIDAARFLGLPADMIDASPSSTSYTYANVSQRAQTLIDYGLAPIGAAIEARLSMPDITPAGTSIRFVYGELTEPSDANPTTSPPSATGASA